jgi:dihydroorotase-like cyclic amidohydrolase
MNGPTEDSIEMGPIDYIVVEWPDRQPTGDAVPHLIELVDRGIIRIIDLAFITKEDDGSVARLELADLGDAVEAYAVFEGASSGLLSDEDTDEAANALEPGTSAAVLVYENKWAAPFATALRQSGAQLVAGGRIPIDAMAAALEAAEAA